MANPKYTIFRGKNEQFYFNLRAENGEIVLQSEAYTTKANCQNGIDSVRRNAPIDGNYERKMSSDGKYYFVLKAANNEPIGSSETYESEQGREIGIAAVKDDGPTAPVEDQS